MFFYKMPVSYIIFTSPDFTVDTAKFIVNKLQSNSLSGVGATLGIYSVGSEIIVKLDCASATSESPRLRYFKLHSSFAIVLEDDPDFVNSCYGADVYGILGWVAPQPPSPLVPETSNVVSSTSDPTPNIAGTQSFLTAISTIELWKTHGVNF